MSRRPARTRKRPTRVESPERARKQRRRASPSSSEPEPEPARALAAGERQRLWAQHCAAAHAYARATTAEARREARHAMRAVLRARERRLGAAHSDALYSKFSLATMVLADDDASASGDDATQLLGELATASAEALGSADRLTLVATFKLALHTPRNADALALFQRLAVVTRRRRGTFFASLRRNVEVNLPPLFLALGQPHKALPLLEKTLGAMVQAHGPNYRETAFSLARCLCALGRFDRGLQEFRRVSQLYQINQPGSADHLQTRLKFVESLLDKGDLEQAESTLETQSWKLADDTEDKQDKQDSVDRCKLLLEAELHLLAKNPKKAQEAMANVAPINTHTSVILKNATLFALAKSKKKRQVEVEQTAEFIERESAMNPDADVYSMAGTKLNFYRLMLAPFDKQAAIDALKADLAVLRKHAISEHIWRYKELLDELTGVFDDASDKLDLSDRLRRRRAEARAAEADESAPADDESDDSANASDAAQADEDTLVTSVLGPQQAAALERVHGDRAANNDDDADNADRLPLLSMGQVLENLLPMLLGGLYDDDD